MNWKRFASTRKGQLILACSALAAVWLVILLNWLFSSLDGVPDRARIAKLKAELVKVRREYEKAESEQNAARDVRRRYRELAAASWFVAHDGAIETGLRRRISAVAQKQDFKLNSIGSVRTGRINAEFSYADIDISGSGDLGDVVRLLAGLAGIEPRLAWRRLDLRPDNRFRRNTGAGGANLAAQVNIVPETRINFSGTLRVFHYEGPLSIRDLQITRPSAAKLAEEPGL
ncbi:MAG: hypothetical protein MR051_06800 [Lentisphaeria bacterium]|nr:hypothetical protein [Lentisphaeria bacterium]